VSWGRNEANRRQALDALRRIVAGIEGLDAFVAKYDARVAESGLDAPVLRKTFGLVYLAKGEAGKAATQLQAARALQPDDDEIHTALVAAHDTAGEPAEALGALLEGIAAAPFALELYVDLASRFEKAGDAQAAERARTSLVERTPNEAAGHARLGRIFEDRKRWDDALVQWRQVARVRSDEPDGWLGVARTLLATKQYDEARGILARLLGTAWESRFGDVHGEARKLQDTMPR
jgi:tetratricopeptide (TPR) repeat protein